MFKSVVKTTPLCNQQANSFFKNITGDRFQSDVSFISTLRALVAPRMKDGENLYLRFTSTNYSESTIRGTSVERMCSALFNNFYSGDTGSIYIHNIKRYTKDEDITANLQFVETHFESRYKGWSRLEKVTDFYHKQFKCLCYINPKLKSVAVFAGDLTISRMHYLQCSIFAFLPWYFDPKKGVSEIEMKLIESLRDTSVDKYSECLAEIASQYDFRSAAIKKMLAGFETKFEKMEIERLKNAILRTIDSIESYNRDIGNLLAKKNDQETKLLGLETKVAGGSGEESEIMNYFLCNKKLTLFNVDNTYMTFAVKDYISYFNEDMAKKVLNNPSSYVYKQDGYSYSDNISKEDIKTLLTAIFLDQKIKVRVCASYTFNINGNVTANKLYAFGSDFDDCTPNPHIDRYTCMGNYKQAINSLLVKRDYIGAIEQCCASCKSLNFGDSTVMKEFMRTIYGVSDYYSHNPKCLELPDGNIVTPKEAIKWLTKGEDNEQSN